MSESYREDLRQYLEVSWDDVSLMSLEEAQQLFDGFIEVCVKPEFARKFKKEFNSNRRIGERFFRRHVEVQRKTSLKEALQTEINLPLHVQVLYYSFQDPAAFSLWGRVSAIDRIFPFEGDAIAKLILPKKTEHLFLCGHTDALYRFPAL